MKNLLEFTKELGFDTLGVLISITMVSITYRKVELNNFERTTMYIGFIVGIIGFISGIALLFFK